MVEDKTWDKLREMRIKAGKTVPEVSKYLQSIGLKAATQTIYGWERGHSQPTIDTFIEMCRFYGVSDVFSYFGDVPEISDVISISEREHIKKYRLLDPYGKEAVDGVLDVEPRRCQEERDKQAAILREQREQLEVAEEIAPEDVYSIPLYFLPMSAGTGEIAAQEYPEDFLLKKRPPRGTSFIACVSGNSMEPTYYNGDLVFIHATVDLRQGQIGAFLMDGQLWIKELGSEELISHNPDYAPRPFTDDIRCQGLVLGVCDESYFE